MKADANGNATYVHPKEYGGYNALNSEIQYITELIFPSSISVTDGTVYPVVHIGGHGSALKTGIYTYYRENYSKVEDDYQTSGYEEYTYCNRS